jgi:hypothetical protein
VGKTIPEWPEAAMRRWSGESENHAASPAISNLFIDLNSGPNVRWAGWKRIGGETTPPVQFGILDARSDPAALRSETFVYLSSSSSAPPTLTNPNMWSFKECARFMQMTR